MEGKERKEGGKRERMERGGVLKFRFFFRGGKRIFGGGGGGKGEDGKREREKKNSRRIRERDGEGKR